MHLFHIPQCTIQNRNMHISVLNGAIWHLWNWYIMGFVRLVYFKKMGSVCQMSPSKCSIFMKHIHCISMQMMNKMRPWRHQWSKVPPQWAWTYSYYWPPPDAPLKLLVVFFKHISKDILSSSCEIVLRWNFFKLLSTLKACKFKWDK